MTPKRHLGWLGPAIVLVGLAVGAVGVWYMIHAKPKAGAVIDTIVVDDQTKVVIRAEDGGDDRSFVELYVGDKLMWQALVPHYAGKAGQSGVAVSPDVVSVRVLRDHKAELFVLSRKTAAKVGGFQLGQRHKGETIPDAPGPLTITDHIRSYEFLSGKDWHELVVVDLHTGMGVWNRELGSLPVVSARIKGPDICFDQGQGEQCFLLFNGSHDERDLKIP
ncbi:MAG TPA: hypothetical protein VGM88_01165 [Kofleriaceae bacterium]